MPSQSSAQPAERSDFESIAMEHIDSLYNTAYRMARSPEDAEDLVQEAYLKAYKYYDKFDPGTNFKAWIFKILKNSFINHYRKKQKQPPRSDFAEIEDAFESRVSDEATGRLDTPEDVLLKDVLDEHVQQALDELPEDYRMAVLLADLESFSYKEIASILEVPVGTVMSRLYRGRKQLEEALLRYAREHNYLSGDGAVKRRSKTKKN